MITGVTVLALVAAGLAAYRVLDGGVPGLVLTERCTVTGTGGEVTLSPEQAGNAATIAAVAVRRGLPRQAVVIALAAALQESKLRNLDGGDRDSVGLFQQRPSQGWGTPAQIQDPVYAAGRFYDRLEDVPGYQELPVTVAAQRVQRSAGPNAYARHETDARVLAGALTGARAAALSCRLRTGDHPEERFGPAGLTPRAVKVRTELGRDFGRLSLGGFQPGGVSSGHMPGSAHYEGRAIDVLFRPVTRANQRDGWATAHWAVARADALAITEVIYDGKIWTARRSAQGWRPYQPAGGDTGNPILMHRDHVHLTVA
jgi:hypothetical protein